MLAAVKPDEPLLGVGRSGIVFRSTSPSGEAVARKVFDSRSLTRVVQYAVLGASNPYAWNIHAVSCAFLRRRILAPLVERWTGGRVRVARAMEHLVLRQHKCEQAQIQRGSFSTRATLHLGFALERNAQLNVIQVESL